MSILEVLFKIYKAILLTISFVFAFTLLTGCSKYEGVRKNLGFAFPEYFKCDVVQVIGGDSFYCQFQRDRDIEKVKLAGIETPELIAERARGFTQSLLTRGTPVKLEQDVEGRDEYGRILAYVYVPGGKMLNALLLQEGYAEAMAVSPNVKYKDMFLKLESDAKEQGKGIWERK